MTNTLTRRRSRSSASDERSLPALLTEVYPGPSFTPGGALVSGALYLWSPKEADKCMLIGRAGLSLGLVSAIQGVLAEDELVVTVAARYRYVDRRGEDAPSAPLPELLPHLLWCISFDDIKRVRQGHERPQNCYYQVSSRDTNVHIPPGTNLQFRYLEPDELASKLL